MRAAREAAGRVVRHVDPARPRAVGRHGQLAHGVRQPLDGVARRRGGRGELGDLLEERVERLARGARRGRRRRARTPRRTSARRSRAGEARRRARAPSGASSSARRTKSLARLAAARRRARDSARRAAAAESTSSSPRWERRSGPSSAGDGPVERGQVAPAAEADPRAPHLAGDRRGGEIARAALAALRPVRAPRPLRPEAAQRQGAGRERLAETPGRVAAADPLEKRERGLARAAVGRGDAAGERARDPVLARQLPGERRIHGLVGVEDLDLVERDPLPEDAPERLAQLVLLADGAEETRAARRLGPGLGGVDRELRGGDRPRAARGRAARRRRARRLPGIRNSASLEAPRRSTPRAAAPRSRPRSGPRRGARRSGRGSARISFGLRGSAKADAGIASASSPAARSSSSVSWSARWRPGPITEPPEVRARVERLGARLLDERERLGARQEAQAVLSESRPDRAEGERADGLDAQVDPRVALAREPLDQRVADGQRGRDEDLLLERMLARRRGRAPR